MFDECTEMRCPYCNSTESCSHLLLSVDLTFREAGAGLLYEAFKTRWYEILEGEENNPSFDEREAFEELLEEVNSHADFEMTLGIDTAPGMSSTYQIYYCSTDEHAQSALESFKEAD
jgi:hypothetical protein